MTGRLGRNGETAVNCDAVEDVIWIVHQPERAQAPALGFPQHLESACWCARTMDLTVVHIELPVTSRDWQYAHDLAALVDDKQYLSFQIDLGVRITPMPRLWTCRSAQSIQFV